MTQFLEGRLPGITARDVLSHHAARKFLIRSIGGEVGAVAKRWITARRVFGRITVIGTGSSTAPVQ